MFKKSVSFLLCGILLAVAMPLSFAATKGDTTVFGVPILSVDKVINDFNNVSTDSTATVGDYTVPTGVGKNNTEKTETDYSANAWSANNTVTIENGVLKSTLNAKGELGVSVYITPQSLTRGNTFPSENSIALQFHVDFTGVTSREEGTKVTVEPKIYFSTGSMSGDYCYCIPEETFYYLPDATPENPNPQMEIHTTEGGVQLHHGCVWGYAGQSGTIILPFDAWDTERMAQFNGSMTVWDLYKYDQMYRNRSMVFFTSYQENYAAGDVFAFDDICWMKKVEKTFDKTIVAQDFSSITSNDLGGWGNGVAWAKGENMIISNGRLQLKRTCDGTGRSTTQFEIDPWNDSFEAFGFDLDASEFTSDEALGTDGVANLRLSYAVNSTATTAYASCYFSGIMKFVWEDGTVSETQCYEYGKPIPKGFKGKVIVPASAVILSDDVKAAIAAGGKNMFTVELMSQVSTQKDKSVYIDNFVFYDSNEQLDDSVGVNFAEMEDKQWETEAPVVEDVATIEAYFKTEANFTQSILGTKFGNVSYHSDSIDVQLTPTGQLVMKVGSAKVNATNVVLNDGKWHHVAVVADTENRQTLCYVDGELVATAPLLELVHSKQEDYLPLTVGSFMPALRMDYNIFDGKIANVRLWDDVRTAEELKTNAKISVGADAEGLVAEWMMDGESFAKETTGKYDLVPFYWNITTENELFDQYNRDAAEGEFTILYLPDTQSLTKSYQSQIPEIFDWILANAERLNVKAVVSLGDIVEYGTIEADFATMSAQYQRLVDAGIPVVATIGDHDYNSFENRDKTLYDKYFTKDLVATNEWFKLGGLKEENSLLNGYYLLNIGANTKILIMNLEAQPTDETLAWAGEVIINHPDYRVMIATHRYMNRPSADLMTEDPYNHGNTGQQMWEKLVSQYANIDMILCGHAETSGVYTRTDNGVNGNKVLQVGCDMQDHDHRYKTLGAILIGRFNERGDNVSFNLYSAHHNMFVDNNSNDIQFALNPAAEIEEHTVQFKDNNGIVIKEITVANGTVIPADSVPAAPGRYGYTFIGWSEDFSLPVMTDIVITANYEKETEMQYEVNVGEGVEIQLPEGQTKCYYNDRIKLIAPEFKDGEEFSYWSVNGCVFSFTETVSFLTFGNMEIEAVYGEEVAHKNVVFIDSNPTVTVNDNSFDMNIMGVVYSEGNVSEIGVILAADEYTAEEMIGGNVTTAKLKAAKATNGRQFVYTVKNIKFDHIRTAVVYAVIDGETYYSQVSCSVTVESDGFEFGGDEIIDEDVIDPFK